MASVWCILLLATTVATTGYAQLSNTQNPLNALDNFPNFSSFRKLLNDSGVIQEITSRSSLTLLVPENSVVDAVLNRSSNSFPLPLVADVLRYHCLLQYLDIPQIRSMVANTTGVLVTSLYQTTGRAAGQNGFVNVSVGSDGAIHAGIPFADSFNASISRNITQFPYNISYMQVDHVLVPADLGGPQAAAASILNMTRSLQRAGRFNSFLNLMQTTGLTAVLASLPAFTVFAPTDDAFSALPKQALDSLSTVQASQLLSYHVLPSYSSFGTLQSQSNRKVQTLASNGNNQRFLVQVTNNGGAVSLSTGTNVAQVVSAVMDQPPVAAYSINRVLLPRELFRTSASESDQSSFAPSPGAPVLAPAAAAPGGALSPPAAASAPPPQASSSVPVSPGPTAAAAGPQTSAQGSQPSSAFQVSALGALSTFMGLALFLLS